jgi:diacylglycerol O-acyltransferase
MVPVSVRTERERGTYYNRVSAMFAELPVGIMHAGRRLESIRTQMVELKLSKEAVAGEVLTSIGGFAPPLLLAIAERFGTRVPQHSINTVTTNVPGPRYHLYAADRRMLEVFPYVPLGGHVRVGVAIFSYNGALTFGVTGDYDSAPDIDVLCAGIEQSVAELVAHAGSGEKRGLSEPERPGSSSPPAGAARRAHVMR